MYAAGTVPGPAPFRRVQIGISEVDDVPASIMTVTWRGKDRPSLSRCCCRNQSGKLSEGVLMLPSNIDTANLFRRSNVAALSKSVVSC